MASQWLGALPPPPGVEPNFDNPPSQEQSMIALHVVCLTLVTASVVMRFYTRYFITRSKWGLDDAFCLLSYGLTVCYSALMLKCHSRGLGRHMWDVPFQWLIPTLRFFTIAQYIYLALSLFIKLTLLAFYYRVFSLQRTTTKWVLHGVIALVVALNGGIFFATLFNCNPRERSWDPTVPGECIDPKILPWLSGASSSLTDIFVLFFPLPILWGLNMSPEKKAKVVAVFGLGLFACVASIVRLSMTPVLSSSVDATWNISTISIWATLEVNVGIICACLMLFPAFLERHLPTTVKDRISTVWSHLIGSTFGKNSSNPSWRIAGGSAPLRNKSPSESNGSTQYENSYVELKDQNGSNHAILQTRNVTVESRPAHPTATLGGHTHQYYAATAVPTEDIEAQRLQSMAPVVARGHGY